jgi:hypothetical protein
VATSRCASPTRWRGSTPGELRRGVPAVPPAGARPARGTAVQPCWSPGGRRPAPARVPTLSLDSKDYKAGTQVAPPNGPRARTRGGPAVVEATRVRPGAMPRASPPHQPARSLVVSGCVEVPCAPPGDAANSRPGDCGPPAHAGAREGCLLRASARGQPTSVRDDCHVEYALASPSNTLKPPVGLLSRPCRMSERQAHRFDSRSTRTGGAGVLVLALPRGRR